MKISKCKREKSIPLAINEILMTKGKRAGLSARKLAIIKKIGKIIFSGDDRDWLMKFRFDLSFGLSGDELRGVRFSCNGQRDESWSEKVRMVFGALFGDNAERQLMSTIGKNSLKMSTLGFDWGAESRWPKLKLYFEIGDEQKEKDILKIIGLKSAAPKSFSMKGLSSCAIAIVFEFRKKPSHKIYYFVDKSRAKELFKKSDFGGIHTKGMGESNYFFLLAVGFFEGRTVSRKLYLMYESREFFNKTQDVYERYLQLEKNMEESEYQFLMDQKNIFQKKISSEIIIYPIGLSFDLLLGNKLRSKTIYLSLKEK